jgi:hypothetical protein
MKYIYSTILILFSFSSLGQTQFFIDAFDVQFVKTDASLKGTSILSGISATSPGIYDIEIGQGQGTYQTLTGPMMLGVLRMYRTTLDITYLNTFVEMTKNVQDHRDDRMQLGSEGDEFPVRDGGAIIATWTPGIGPVRPNAPTWSRYGKYENELLWYAGGVYSGEVIYPMAEYIHFVRVDYPSLASEPIPLVGFATHGDYANWLEAEIKLTIEAFYDAAYPYDTGVYRRDIFKLDFDPDGYPVFNLFQGVDDFLTPHNFATSLGRTYAVLFDCTTDPIYKAVLENRLRHLKQNWFDNAHLTPYLDGYTWFEKQVGLLETHEFEEIAHATYAVQMALHCNEYGITDGVGDPLYSDDFIRKLTNTLMLTMYNQPLDFWASVDGTDTNCNGCNPTSVVRLKRSVYGWLPLTNSGIYYTSSADYRERDIYNILADYYLERMFQHPDGWGGTGSIPMALANQAYFFSVLDELLDPISRNRSAGAGSLWAGAEGGDIDGDGIDEVVGIRNSSIGPKLLTYKLEIDPVPVTAVMYNTNVLATLGTPDRDYRDVAVGDFNATHANEEIMVISNDEGNIYMYQYTAGVLTETMAYTAPSMSSNWRGIAAGDFIPGNGKDEFVAVRNLDGRFFMMQYFPGTNTVSSILSWYGPISRPDWGRISCGDLDGDGRKDDIVALENSTGNIYTFLYNEVAGVMDNGPSYTAASSTSDWTDVTCGKFCDKNQLADDIYAHRALDGDATLFRIIGSDLVPVKGTFFTSGSQHDIWGAGNLKLGNSKDELICLRNVDGDVLTYNAVIGCELIQNERERSVENDNSQENDLNREGIILKAYPNPSSDYMRLEIANYNNKLEYQATLADLSGKILFSAYINYGALELDLKNFEHGIYLLRVTDGNNVETLKITKE